MTDDLHWREIEKLREKMHLHGNLLAELGDMSERVTALETKANRFMGALAVIVFLSGGVGALLLKLVD